jgi:hypothetical protein
LLGLVDAVPVGFAIHPRIMAEVVSTRYSSSR